MAWMFTTIVLAGLFSLALSVQCKITDKREGKEC